MDNQILDHLRQEEAELSRKLEAVRGVIAVYAPDEPPRLNSAPATHVASELVNRPARSSRDSYANDVRAIATDIIRNSATLPVRTQVIVDAVKGRGIAIRGQNELNAMSALLSRSPDFVSNGRTGWTLASMDKRYGLSPDENEAPNGKAAGASEAGWGATQSFHQPELTHD